MVITQTEYAGDKGLTSKYYPKSYWNLEIFKILTKLTQVKNLYYLCVFRMQQSNTKIKSVMTQKINSDWKESNISKLKFSTVIFHSFQSLHFCDLSEIRHITQNHVLGSAIINVTSEVFLKRNQLFFLNKIHPFILQ